MLPFPVHFRQNQTEQMICLYAVRLWELNNIWSLHFLVSRASASTWRWSTYYISLHVLFKASKLLEWIKHTFNPVLTLHSMGTKKYLQHTQYISFRSLMTRCEWNIHLIVWTVGPERGGIQAMNGVCLLWLYFLCFNRKSWIYKSLLHW